MNITILINFVNNAALLMTLGLLYDLTGLKWRVGKTSFQQALSGIVIGIIGLAVMSSPWEFTPGLFFDTRSILLAVSGLFFGTIPTTVAVVMTSLYRLYQGGSGALTGITVIIVSAAIGVAWRHLRRSRLDHIPWHEIYFFGVVVHIAMLLSMFILPLLTALDVLAKISLPVMLVYPVGTALLGRLMSSRLGRYALEVSLQESEAKFRGVIEQSHDAIVLTDESGRVTKWNHAAKMLFGISEAEAVDLFIWDIQQRFTVLSRPMAEAYEQLKRMLQIYLKSGKGDLLGHPYDTEIFLPNGKQSTIQSVAFTVRTEKGYCLCSITRDITERRQMEAEQRRSEAELKKAQHVAHVGSWVWHIQTNKLEWSDEMFHIFGIERETFSDSLADVIAHAIHPDDVDKVEQSNLSVIRAGKPIPLEYRVIWPDQSVHVVWGEAGELVLDGSGNPLTLSGIVQDITERKNLEQTMIEGEKLAGIGTLAAGIAHEINSPLQVITGLSETVQRELKEGQGISPETLSRKLENINRNAWRIAAIVRSLLDYARSPTDDVQVFSINEVVTKTLALLGHQFKTWSNITISTELAEGLPLVTCDPNRVTQVLINLLSNARDAMPDGGWITIQTGVDEPGNRVILRVKDSGQGIPDEIRAKIFDPFFTTKPVGKGTGLGLSIAAGILRAHGGELELESSDKKGSIFKISLPLSGPPLPGAADNQLGRY